MGMLDFKGKAQAEKWKSDLADLNIETDAVLQQVYTCLEEIKSESSGDFVEQLLVTSADMASAAANMIEAMKSLESIVQNIIAAFTDWVGKAVQEVVDSRNKMTDM